MRYNILIGEGILCLFLCLLDSKIIFQSLKQILFLLFIIVAENLIVLLNI
nr:MAG TPA: hypothetical protein [Caudoviricetes sp.]DAS61408.1 MAG TPA: hypothetical protein [Caudoviricetes sp.]